MKPYLSIVIPVFNEAEVLHPFLEKLRKSMQSLSCEVLLVDDGSTDGSLDILKNHIAEDNRFHVVEFTRNFGQTAALAAGFELAKGEIIVCLDADGQNDPADIQLLVKEIERGADVVSGWRHSRKDAYLSRRLPSILANQLISRVTGVFLKDYGCTLKAYRKNVLKNLRLYGEMHRFIPAWCAWQGARIKEVKVQHHPRTGGRSKYGIGRIFKVVLDLITAKFFSSYLTKPSYFFGGVGFLFIFVGFFTGLFPIIDKFIFNLWGHLRIPFMILTVFLGLIGIQFVVLGLLAEILIRIYYATKDERPYRIAHVHGASAPHR